METVRISTDYSVHVLKNRFYSFITNEQETKLIYQSHVVSIGVTPHLKMEYVHGSTLTSIYKNKMQLIFIIYDVISKHEVFKKTIQNALTLNIHQSPVEQMIIITDHKPPFV